jgi:ferredoxin
MIELKFDIDLCQKCSTQDCLVKCQYLKLDKDTAKAEIQKIYDGEDSFVLHNCVTCYACEEYCPMGNHPFYLIVERQEEKGKLTAPRPITQQWINMCEPAGRPRVGKIKDKAWSSCFIPALSDLVKGKLFEDIAPSNFMGQEFFCNVVYLHFAKASVVKKRLPKVIENIAELGAKEIIMLHDECYSSFTSLASAYGIEVPFKVTHYFEYLYNKLKELNGEISPLNIRAVYQRPCSSRLAPEKEHFIDDIFELIGVQRIERNYDRENALCCGEVIRITKGLEGFDIANDNQEKNIADMVDSGADYCVFNCPYCQMGLSEKVADTGIKPVHMVDLCKLAIGEKPGKGVLEYGRYL